MMAVTKIVITGGPCAGKSTALKQICDVFSRCGYAVLCIAEIATELISGGIAPWTCRTRADYQTYLLKLQLAKEAIYEQAARAMNSDKILIVCDRGAMDNKAYLENEEFATLLRELNISEDTLQKRYDAVFHLVTAAKGATQAYTAENNAARTETPEQAALLDDRLLAAWAGHPQLRVIDNATGFDDKMKRLMEEIAAFLDCR